jgi:hypothetical protein
MPRILVTHTTVTSLRYESVVSVRLWSHTPRNILSFFFRDCLFPFSPLYHGNCRRRSQVDSELLIPSSLDLTRSAISCMHFLQCIAAWDLRRLVVRHLLFSKLRCETTRKTKRWKSIKVRLVHDNG